MAGCAAWGTSKTVVEHDAVRCSDLYMLYILHIPYILYMHSGTCLRLFVIASFTTAANCEARLFILPALLDEVARLQVAVEGNDFRQHLLAVVSSGAG